MKRMGLSYRTKFLETLKISWIARDANSGLTMSWNLQLNLHKKAFTTYLVDYHEAKQQTKTHTTNQNQKHSTTEFVRPIRLVAYSPIFFDKYVVKILQKCNIFVRFRNNKLFEKSINKREKGTIPFYKPIVPHALSIRTPTIVPLLASVFGRAEADRTQRAKRGNELVSAVHLSHSLPATVSRKFFWLHCELIIALNWLFALEEFNRKAKGHFENGNFVSNPHHSECEWNFITYLPFKLTVSFH